MVFHDFPCFYLTILIENQKHTVNIIDVKNQQQDLGALPQTPPSALGRQGAGYKKHILPLTTSLFCHLGIKGSLRSQSSPVRF
jgi:hypothetical protein